ncbi:MAG: hypothetical protein NC114_08990 [Ruminococcus flavefaciens]|nr:hypothetical protein [Ruminococcus flavefaciens]
MTKKIKTIIIAVSLVLIVALAAGLIARFATKDKADKPILNDIPQYELSGKVYDDTGNEMLASRVYSMPRAMTFSELEDDTVSQVTITATVSPENATDGTIEWSIKFDDDSDTDYYLTLTPTYYGSNTAVLTCLHPFDYKAIITATSNYDATKTATCNVDYLYQFDPIDLKISWNNIVFNEENSVTMDYDFCGYGTIEGDFEYGDLYIELDGSVVNEISSRLGFEFTPTYKILSDGYTSGEITFNVPSPYACFAAGSGIEETTFNEAFTRAIYFGCGEDCDYHAIIHFTAKYSYMGDIVTTEEIWHDGYERLSVDFSLDGLVIPVEDVTINNGNIIFGTETSEPVVCYFDNEDGSIVTDSKFKVTGNQSKCSEIFVQALGKSFTKYLKIESSTQVTFTTAVNTTITLYVNTANRKIKVDGVSYLSEVNEYGDNVVTVMIAAGAHTITKGDMLGLFALTLDKA